MTKSMSTDNNEYQRGYSAGKKQGEKDAQLRDAIESKKERVYMQSLDLALKHCAGWQIGGKTINTAEGYCTLAKIFADNSIKSMSS